MPRFKKKPVLVRAFRYYIDNQPDWFCNKVSSNDIITFETHCEIKTLEGTMRGEVGDYIIQGVKGEIYPCKPDIFQETYESAPHLVMVCGVDCNPGDGICNNYCNMAPQKGPMQSTPPKGPDA